MTAVAANFDILGRNVPRKQNGRYLRSTVLPSPDHSFWRRVLRSGDAMDFFHFTGLSRRSFEDLVDVCRDDILTLEYLATCRYMYWQSRSWTPPRGSADMDGIGREIDALGLL